VNSVNNFSGCSAQKDRDRDILCHFFFSCLLYDERNKCLLCSLLSFQVAKQSSKSGSIQRLEKECGSSSATTKKTKSRGFRNDVRAALSVLRHKLRLEQKQVRADHIFMVLCFTFHFIHFN